MSTIFSLHCFVWLRCLKEKSKICEIIIRWSRIKRWYRDKSRWSTIPPWIVVGLSARWTQLAQFFTLSRASDECLYRADSINLSFSHCHVLTRVSRFSSRRIAHKRESCKTLACAYCSLIMFPWVIADMLTRSRGRGEKTAHHLGEFCRIVVSHGPRSKRFALV